jgi:hypothetical protein
LGGVELLRPPIGAPRNDWHLARRSPARPEKSAARQKTGILVRERWRGNIHFFRSATPRSARVGFILGGQKLATARDKAKTPHSFPGRPVLNREGSAPSFEPPVGRREGRPPSSNRLIRRGRIALPLLTERFGPGGRLSLLMTARRKEGRRRSLCWRGVLDREDGAPCLRRAIRRGRTVLPVSNAPSGRGRTAFPAGREPPEGSPALRKDRRRMGSFALRRGPYILAPLPCAQRLDAELDQLLARVIQIDTSQPDEE